MAITAGAKPKAGQPEFLALKTEVLTRSQEIFVEFLTSPDREHDIGNMVAIKQGSMWEQQQSILNYAKHELANRKYSFRPLVISTPPGTGKTRMALGASTFDTFAFDDGPRFIQHGQPLLREEITVQHMLKASLLIVPSHTVKQFKSEARACLRLSLGTDILVYESGEEFNTEMADTEDDMKKIMAAKVIILSVAAANSMSIPSVELEDGTAFTLKYGFPLLVMDEVDNLPLRLKTETSKWLACVKRVVGFSANLDSILLGKFKNHCLKTAVQQSPTFACKVLAECTFAVGSEAFILRTLSAFHYEHMNMGKLPDVFVALLKVLTPSAGGCLLAGDLLFLRDRIIMALTTLNNQLKKLVKKLSGVVAGGVVGKKHTRDSKTKPVESELEKQRKELEAWIKLLKDMDGIDFFESLLENWVENATTPVFKQAKFFQTFCSPYYSDILAELSRGLQAVTVICTNPECDYADRLYRLSKAFVVGNACVCKECSHALTVGAGVSLPIHNAVLPQFSKSRAIVDKILGIKVDENKAGRNAKILICTQFPTTEIQKFLVEAHLYFVNLTPYKLEKNCKYDVANTSDTVATLLDKYQGDYEPYVQCLFLDPSGLNVGLDLYMTQHVFVINHMDMDMLSQSFGRCGRPKYFVGRSEVSLPTVVTCTWEGEEFLMGGGATNVGTKKPVLEHFFHSGYTPEKLSSWGCRVDTSQPLPVMVYEHLHSTVESAKSKLAELSAAGLFAQQVRVMQGFVDMADSCVTDLVRQYRGFLDVTDTVDMEVSDVEGEEVEGAEAEGEGSGSDSQSGSESDEEEKEQEVEEDVVLGEGESDVESEVSDSAQNGGFAPEYAPEASWLLRE